MSLLHNMALTLVPGVGDKIGRTLIRHCGSAEAVFRESVGSLQKIPDIGLHTAQQIARALPHVWGRAEQEYAFIQKHGIRALWYEDYSYPLRLKQCEDAPLLLFYKGSADLNHRKIIGIVGTRRATDYGRQLCGNLVEELQSDEVLIASGLAYGIDTHAHQTALDQGLSTVAVLGHGLDRIYPAENRHLAERMLSQGGLITEFWSGTKPDAINFPRRNRIVAGLCDAVVVIEAALEGGALITADIANSYNRDVFAFPGRIGDTASSGCNRLIKINKAALIETAQDLRYILGWEKPLNPPTAPQRDLFPELSEDQQTVYRMLLGQGDLYLGDLLAQNKMPLSGLTTALVDLELQGLVLSKPGDRYRLVN